MLKWETDIVKVKSYLIIYAKNNNFSVLLSESNHVLFL